MAAQPLNAVIHHLHRSLDSRNARLSDGDFRQVILLGVDDASLIGAPRDMVLGSVAALRRPFFAEPCGNVGAAAIEGGDPLKRLRRFGSRRSEIR